MNTHLLITHSALRWLVLISFIFLIYKCWQAYQKQQPMTRPDHIVKGIAVGFFNLQVILGFVLYFVSPITKYFMAHPAESLSNAQMTFFGLVHITCMTIAAVLVTIGSALVARDKNATGNPLLLLKYIGVSLLLIIVAIPWPFLSWGARPWLRFE